MSRRDAKPENSSDARWRRRVERAVDRKIRCQLARFARLLRERLEREFGPFDGRGGGPRR